MAAQFLGAFNDNALRWFLIALAMREVTKEEIPGIMKDATKWFLLPFILFSMHAGSLADHFSKRSVLILSKAAELVVMIYCCVGLYCANDFSRMLPVLLVGLFFMGAQSTYYSPSKFGILPEILPEKRLSWGNGIFEMTGMLAIILGTVTGGECVGWFGDRLYFAPLLFAVVAALGLVATWFVPAVPPASPMTPVRINPLRPLISHGGKLIRHRILLLTLLSVVFIWSLGLLFQLNIALYGKEELGLPDHRAAHPMGMVAIGVGVGTVLAGYLSGKTIEVGLVPIGALGVALSSVALYFTPHSMGLTFLSIISLGVFAGLFIVPTHALLQEESPAEDKGGIWAATNLLQTVGMLLTAEVFAYLHEAMQLNAPQVFLVCGFGTIALAAALLSLMPEGLGRMLVWMRTCFRRVRVHGQHHVPPQGSVVFLLVGNATASFHLLLSGTRRFVRFVLPDSLCSKAWVRSVLRSLGGVCLPNPVPAELEGRIVETLRRALERGEAVAALATSAVAGNPGTATEAATGLSRMALERILSTPGVTVVPVRIQRQDRRIAVEFEAPWNRSASLEAWIETIGR